MDHYDEQDRRFQTLLAMRQLRWLRVIALLLLANLVATSIGWGVLFTEAGDITQQIDEGFAGLEGPLNDIAEAI